MSKEGKRSGRFSIFCVGVVVGAVAMIALAVTLVAVGISLPSEKDSPTNTTKTEEQIIFELENKIEASDELTVTKVQYAGITVDDSSIDLNTPLFTVTVPFTRDATLIAYKGTIGLGFNLDDIEYKVDQNAKKIYVTLPEIQALYTTFDNDSCKSYKLVDSVFNETDFEASNEIIENVKSAETESHLADEETTTQATENAKTAITSLITALPVAEGYTVEFTD